MTPNAQLQALTERSLDEIAASTVQRERTTALLERLTPLVEDLHKAEQLRLAEETAKAEEKGKQAARVEAEEAIAAAEAQKLKAEAEAEAVKGRGRWRDVLIGGVSALISLLLTGLTAYFGLSGGTP